MGPNALIDLSSLRHNLQRVREAAPGSRVMAVIKSNGYGHGMLRVARALGQADALAVARVEEAVALRQSGIPNPLVVLEGFFDRSELAAASRDRIALAISRPEQLELLQATPLPDPVTCWLKVDTGMHRLGFEPARAADAWQRLGKMDSVAQPLRLMSHFANADDLDDPTSSAQLERFTTLVQRFRAEASMANSAGVLGWPGSHLDWVRPGIMLYGASPLLGGRAARDRLRPVMTLSSRLIAVNQCRQGDRVGYGGVWHCPESMPVGVVAIGYGDGYPRHAPSGTPVLVNGQRVPLIARVSMDMITVDLRSQPTARVGDPVVLWGRGLPAEEIAEAADTIAYQLFCGVAARVRFTEQGDGGR